MGRAAAAGRGAGGARRWLPWLGLCFWAAGAAAARGKRGAERAAEPGGGRGGRDRWYPHLWPWLSKLRPAPPRARGAQGLALGWRTSEGTTVCLPPQVCDQLQSYRLLGPQGPYPALILFARSLFRALPNCCRLESPFLFTPISFSRVHSTSFRSEPVLGWAPRGVSESSWGEGTGYWETR